VFKNAKVYRMSVPFDWDQMQLHERLGARRFRPCGPQEVATLGWTAPLGANAEMLVHAVDNCYLVAARRQERLLPGSVLAEALAEKVADIEQAEMREVPRRERTRLREELLAQMLPRAFTRSRVVRAYIDPGAGWVVVDAASDKVAEEILSLLRESLDSLPVKPLSPTVPVDERLSGWVAAGAASTGLALEDQCVLRDPEDSRAVVRCRGQDLTAPEVRNHLDAGKRVVALGLTWNEHLSLLLEEDLSLKRLRFADELIDELDTGDADDAGARLDAELVLLSGELRALLGHLEGEFRLEGGTVAD
jgi:recombination associated protein RdgC